MIGPTGFSVNINDIGENVDCDLDQFADDSTAYTTGQTVDNAVSDLQNVPLNLYVYLITQNVHCDVINADGLDSR